MDLITEPGTIDDLVADAVAAGHDLSRRLIRDWTERGLLDNPQKRPAGKGHGSAPALYAASQRNLLLTLLHHRPGNSISSLARIPVGIWMYWGDSFVPIRQVRRALMTWLCDPRVSKQRAADAARQVLGQIAIPHATAAARRELLEVVTQANWTGRADFDRLERAIRAVFEPEHKAVARAIGHISAPVTTDAMISVMKARLHAVTELMNENLSDEALKQAREAHLFAYAEYAVRQPLLAVASPPGHTLYEPVTAEDTLNNCCRHLLTTLGLGLTYPDHAERLRRARAGLPLPSPADVGLTAPAARPQ
jgi:hypothetical protein